MLKIAQVAPYFYPHIGGVESTVLNLSERLVKRGHSVTLITTLVPNTKEREIFRGIEIRRFRSKITIWTVPIVPDITKFIVKSDFDVINAHTPPPLHSYYAAVGCNTKKTPFVLTYHCDLELPEIPALLSGFIVGIYNATIGYYTVRSAAKLIVTTASYAATSRMAWKYKYNIARIPPGVDTNIFLKTGRGREVMARHNLDANDFVVLFVGRLVAHKGLEYLIASVKHTAAKYLIVGDGSIEAKLKKEVAQQHLDKRVIFAGKVEDSALPDYYDACDVLVLPSTSRLEAMGLVILEAFACAKPVIVSDIPGVRDLVSPEEGFVVEPMNEKVLADKINFLQQRPELREELGAKGLKKVISEFSWDKTINKIEDVYFEVCSKR